MVIKLQSSTWWMLSKDCSCMSLDIFCRYFTWYSPSTICEFDWWSGGERKRVGRILELDTTSTSASLCASVTRRMARATSGPYWLNGDCVSEIGATALTLDNRLRLQNGALAKTIFLIEKVDSHLACLIRGGRTVLVVLMFIQHTAQQEARLATEHDWLPPSLPSLSLLITSERSYVKLIKET